MSFPLAPPIEPMLAKIREGIPNGDGWLFEPKWDGFRAIVFRDGDKIHIASRNQRPLERYFPELIPVLAQSLPARCVVDGEIIVAIDGRLEFEALQMRIHPAQSRVKTLSKQTPASYVAFDVLASARKDFRASSAKQRRAKLESIFRKHRRALLTPQTSDPSVAQEWFERFEGAGLDGLIVKKSTSVYTPGERSMFKIKHRRSADCVVIGYRIGKSGDGIGSLLLGLYKDGAMNFVGHTSSFAAKERRELLDLLKPLETKSDAPEGRVPGEPSRWSGGKDLAWVALEPKLVCEVSFDYLEGGYRFRHAARFLRWRTDKNPMHCDFDQFTAPDPVTIDQVRKL